MKFVYRSLMIFLVLGLIVACSGSENKKNHQEGFAQIEAEQAAVAQAKTLEKEAIKRAEESRLEQLAANEKAKRRAEQESLAKIEMAKQAVKQAEQAKLNQMAAAKQAAQEKQQLEKDRKVAEQKVKLLAEAKKKKAEQERLIAVQEAQMAAKAKVDTAAELKHSKEEIRVATMKAQEAAFIKNSATIDSGDKTPVGAQKSGNQEGTIPAWTGGITQPPASYKPGDHHQDPFKNDEIQFTINASNYQEYANNLSVGQKAMFEKYPNTYKMHVYKTRRSASFPERIYQKTIENGKTGRLTGGGEGVENVAEGFPFPNAQNAYELILNHKLKYKGSGGVRYNNQVAPTANGRYTVVKLKEELLGKYYVEGNTVADIDNILLYFYQVVESPARLAGRILLVHETMNQQEQPRQAWIYNPGQRRVRRAPNVAYDNPGTASDGLRTNDMTDMFNGAMDRFNWKVVGKKEMYVPYNSYKVHSGDLDYNDIVRPGHLNPELMRYELHRMYVIEATLKEGVRHINSRRTFFLDEDSYQIMLTDHYDRRGEIWRFSEAHCINYYDVPTFWSTVETHHDLRSGRYVAVGLDNKDPVNTFNVPLSEVNYTPQALRKRGRR